MPSGTAITAAIPVTYSVPIIAWNAPPEVIAPNTPTMSVVRNSQLNCCIPSPTTIPSRVNSGITASRKATVTNAVAKRSFAHLGPSTTRESTVMATA